MRGNSEAWAFLNDVQPSSTVFESIITESISEVTVEHDFRAKRIACSSPKSQSIPFNWIETVKGVIRPEFKVSFHFIARNEKRNNVRYSLELRESFQRISHIEDALFFRC